MEKYVNTIEKYKNLANNPPVLIVIEEILDNAGENGVTLKEIYNALQIIGYRFDNSVIRAYMNRNIVGSTIKGGHNLWHRKDKGVYISKNFYHAK